MKPLIEREIARALGLSFPDNDPVWCDSKEVLLSGGWRAGKTVRGAFKAFCQLLDPSKRLVWLVGPDYLQCREEFRYIFEWAVQLKLIPDPIKMNSGLPQNGSRWLRSITGCRVETKSAKHPETLASVAPDFVLLCEPGQMSSEVYDMAQGRLLERRGDLWMAGTLENEEGVLRPRWQWYEDFAVEWLKNPEGSRERAFCIPTWENTVIFPLGLDDPELQARRAKLPDYTWKRRYGGMPEGIDNPVFRLLHEPGFLDELFVKPPEDLQFHGGAIGVDYGKSWNHPSAVVAVSQDSQGDYWVRAAWKGYNADPKEIESVVKRMENTYGIWQGCCDPNQNFMAETLGYATATGGMAERGSRPTEMRFSLTNGLLENKGLYFDLYGENVREVLASMRSMRWVADSHGKLYYERPIGDDTGMAVTYAVELLRSESLGELPQLSAGSTRITFEAGRDTQRGYI